MHVKNKLWTVADFIKAREQIEYQPMYQRGAVWNIGKRRLLIDSILRRLDVPKIYLNKLSDNPAYQYQIIDGQQRLTSIWQFACDKDLILELPKVLSNSPWHNCSYDELEETHRRRFRLFHLSVGIVQNASDTEVRELFARLQMGERLNPAELRNSIQSTLGVEIRNIAENHRFFSKCKFPVARYKHHDLAAHAFALELYGGKDDLKAANLHDMYIEYGGVVSSRLSQRVAVVLNYLHSVQKTIPDWIDRKWGFVDLYLVVSQTPRKYLPSPNVLGERFRRFEQKRRRNSARPEHLLKGSQKDKDMYSYIQAFKLSGGLLENIKKRNKVLCKRLLVSYK